MKRGASVITRSNPRSASLASRPMRYACSAISRPIPTGSMPKAAQPTIGSLPERAVWDFDLLRGHFKDLIEIDFDVELTGFTTGEIDLVLDGRPGTLDPADDLSGLSLARPAVSKMGDRWELGRHRLICGDALRGDGYQRLA